MARGRTAPRQVEDAQRVAQAVKMRLAGHTYDQIADACGYASRAGAHAAVTRHLDAVRKETAEDAEQLRQQSIERRQAWLTSLQPRIDDGDPQAVSAAERVQQALDRLHGVGKQDEAPTANVTVHVVVPDPRARET